MVVAVSTSPAVVVVEGEAGIGKTRLLNELRARPEAAGLRFLLGACRPVREPFPLGPVVEALRGMAEHIDPHRLSPVAGALRPLVPELSGVLPPRLEPLDDRAAERHRVFRGFAELLASLQPVVLVVEDVHWADLQTVDFVRFLLADPQPGQTVVLTYRAEEVAPDVRALTARLGGSVQHCHVVLEPLDAAQTGELAAAILDAEHVSDGFAAHLCAQAAGLPFAIEEILAVLRARGSLVRREAGWERWALDELEVPAGIRDSVMERVSRLSAEARAMVEAAATLQRPIPPDVILHTAALADHQGLPALEEALTSGVLVEHDEAVGFRHTLSAQAVHDSLVLPRRRELHSRAATAVAGLDPVPLGQLAHHLRHAGRIEEWAGAAERAADQALELGHEDEALRLLDDVLGQAPLEPDQRGRLAVKLARAALQAERFTAAVGQVSTMLEEPDLAPAIRGELRFWLALHLNTISQDPVRQYQLGRGAVEDLDDRPDMRTWAMVNLGMPIVPGVSLTEHLAWLHEARKTLDQISDPELHALLLGKTAMVLIAVGDPVWHRLVDRLEALTNGGARSRLQVSAYHSAGLDACYAGHHDLSRRLLATAREGAAACESPRPRLYVSSAMALLDYCTGRWGDLGSDLALVLDELSDPNLYHVDARVAAGCLALAHGRFDEAERQLRPAQHRATAIGMDALPIPTAALIRLALARGDVADATEVAKQFMSGLDAKPIWPTASRAIPAVVEAMVAADRSSDARSLVTRLSREVRELDAPLAPAVQAHARGVLDADASRWKGAATHFFAAAERYDAVECPYEAAQAREHAAQCLCEVGHDDAGKNALRAAVAVYERLDARWDLDRATGLARARGIALPARHRGGRRGYGADLSLREREVAELASAGLTNKQIADKLYISPNTVKTHLAAAMRKMRVTSRIGLAHRELLPNSNSHPDGR